MSATGGAGTSWSALTVAQMWEMLQGQNQAGYDQLIQGWQQSADVAESHIDYLEDYRSRLVVAWPPSSSEAARACHDQLEVMIASMRETWSAALSNRSTLETIAGALDSAYSTMQQIHQEYEQNKIALAEHDQQVLSIAQQYAGRPVAVPDSPVAAGRQTTLEAEARALMESLSTDLAVGKTMIRTPAQFDYLQSVKKAGGDGREVGGTGTGTGSGTGRGNLRLSDLKDQRDAALAKETGTTPSGGGGTVLPSTGGSGPVLVGTDPAGSGGSSTPSTTTPRPSGSSDSHPSTPVQTAPLGSGRLSGPGATDSFGRSTPVGRPVGGSKALIGEPFAGGRSPIGNGVIGGSGPGTGQPVSGRPSGGRAGQRVNPVGGVLGETPTPSRATGGHGVPGAANGRSRRPDDERDGRRWDPDNPWETDTGVAPLLDAPPEHHINPGPAIGLTKP